MTQVLTNYGSSGQAISCTLGGLASAAARSSAVVDNSTNQFLDALVQLVVKSGASGTVSTGYVNVYAYATADGGTTYPEGCDGTDKGITLTVPTNLRLIGVINVVATATTYKSEPMSVAAAFGGILPQKWGIVVENQSGGALDATETNFTKLYQGVSGLLQ